MDANSIKTAEDYNAALEEIDRLIDAEPDTPEGDRLDVLTTAVNAWEEEHFPIEEPKTGGAVLWQALKEGGRQRPGRLLAQRVVGRTG